MANWSQTSQSMTPHYLLTLIQVPCRGRKFMPMKLTGFRQKRGLEMKEGLFEQLIVLTTFFLILD